MESTFSLLVKLKIVLDYSKSWAIICITTTMDYVNTMGIHGIWLSMPLAELLTAALIFITNQYATFLTKRYLFTIVNKNDSP